ncbi:NAD binding 4 domain containing protein, partial [Asbolus verrucosus]
MDEKDRISEIFRDSTVFITGGTGFLGKVLIEKLLRCTELKRIYLLVRSKKGKTPQERLHDIFNNM